MNDNDWATWSTAHASMFALRSPGDLDMIAFWRPSLDQYSLDELLAASHELLRDPPNFRDKHVAGLLRILASKRAAQARHHAQAEVDEHRTVCGLCQSTGWVLVPHPLCIQGGEFVAGPGGYKATAAVSCSCFVGSRKLTSYDEAERKPMSLHQYEQQVCMAWRDLMAEWDAEKTLQDAIQADAKQRDQKHGPLTAVIKAIGKRLTNGRVG